MTKQQRKIITEALAIIEEVEPEAGAELREAVEYIPDEDITWIVEHMLQADQYGWFFQSQWKKVARAWLLWALAGGPARMSYVPPSKTKMKGFLDQIRNASESKLRAGILSMVLGDELARDATAEATSILTDASRDAWAPARFTNPRQHRPDRYRYIISGLRPTAPEISAPNEVQFLRTHRAAFIKPVQNKPNSVIYDLTTYYLTDPTAVQSEILSCSVISPEKHHTYQNMCFGLVLHVPKYNICNADYRDLVAASVQHTARGSALEGASRYKRAKLINSFLEQLAGKAKRNIATPDQVLASTNVNGHNEVIVVGTFMGQVQVTALFVKTSQGKLWESFVEADKDRWLSNLMHRFAKAQKIPIIQIPDDTGRPSSIDFQVWMGQRLPMTRRLRSPALVPSTDLVTVPSSTIGTFTNVQLSPLEARQQLSLHLNVPLHTGLDELRRVYRLFAKTHHPDKTDDEDKMRKFVEVRGLLTLLENGDTGDGTVRAIEWKRV